MKYKLLKLIEPKEKSISIWGTFVPIWEFVHMDNWLKLPVELLIKQGFIEEVKETPKPKFVVWEYVTCEYEDGIKRYLQIHEISWDAENGYEYNRVYIEKYLREPTRQELKIYFA